MVTKEEVYRYSNDHKDLEYLKDKLIEEMSELTKEIIKWREIGTDRYYSPEFIGEFADVRLMLKQVEYSLNKRYHHPETKFSEWVDRYEQYKCDKLWAIWHNEPLPEAPL